MAEVLDRPGIITDETPDLDDLHGFPESVCLIEVQPGKYAANNGTTPPPDPMVIDGIACFHNEASANAYMKSEKGISGNVVPKTFQEAREIALSKAPKIKGLFLMVGDHIAAIHYTG
jgi:hypothetical protein